MSKTYNYRIQILQKLLLKTKPGLKFVTQEKENGTLFILNGKQKAVWVDKEHDNFVVIKDSTEEHSHFTKYSSGSIYVGNYRWLLEYFKEFDMITLVTYIEELQSLAPAKIERITTHPDNWLRGEELEKHKKTYGEK